MRFLFFLLIFVALGCNSQKFVSQTIDYYGYLPCEDCSYIDYGLQLNPDGTFRESVSRSEEETSTFVQGKYKIDKQNKIKLQLNEVDQKEYLLDNNMVYVLDDQGNKQDDQEYLSYTLTKVKKEKPSVYDLPKSQEIMNPEKELEPLAISEPNNRIHDIWVLKAIDGREMQKGIPAPRIEFNLSQNKVYGNGSCNEYSSQLEINAEQLRFGYIKSGKRACVRSGYESQYFKLLSNNTFSYSFKGLMLFLENDDVTLAFHKVD